MIPFGPQLRRHLVPVDPSTGDTFRVFEVGDEVWPYYRALGVKRKVAALAFWKDSLPAGQMTTDDEKAARLWMQKWFHGSEWDPAVLDPRQRVTVVRFRGDEPRGLFLIRRYADEGIEWLLALGTRTPSDTPILQLALWDTGVRQFTSHLGNTSQKDFLLSVGWRCVECRCFPARGLVPADPNLQYSHWVLDLSHERLDWPADRPIKFTYAPGQDPEDEDVTTLP